MAERYDAVVLGDINIDLVFAVESPPKPSEAVAATSIRMCHGGVGGNLAAALAKLGARVALIGAVGADPFGEVAVRELERAGVDTSRVRVVEGALTGLMVVLVDPRGERAIAGARGANARLKVGEADLELARRSAHVHVSGYSFLNDDGGEGAVKLLEAAGSAGATTSADLEGVAYLESGTLSKLSGLLTVATMSEAEAAAAAGAEEFSDAIGLKLLETLRAKWVVVKLGPSGCLVATRDGAERVPAFRVEVVDTTGAGDAFNAGLIYGLVNGLSIREAALVANAAGAYKCSGWGARHHAALNELAEAFPEVSALLRV